MATCRKCERSFEPTDSQLRRGETICAPCTQAGNRRRYHLRKNEGRLPARQRVSGKSKALIPETLSEQHKWVLQFLALKQQRATAFDIGEWLATQSQHRTNIGRGLASTLVRLGLTERVFDRNLACHFYLITDAGRAFIEGEQVSL